MTIVFLHDRHRKFEPFSGFLFSWPARVRLNTDISPPCFFIKRSVGDKVETGRPTLRVSFDLAFVRLFCVSRVKISEGERTKMEWVGRGFKRHGGGHGGGLGVRGLQKR